uniref:Poly(ADP-ribose) polymerase family member 12 n=1 Tax=Callorhinchus milii TaxID=7868 RepID=A0A4W3HS34_CALMI|eukprot:gi/632947101/ref/XP_007888888.1/ PREDICTED: poly [ADP-ribose] polymerase 12 [Callorhinchus milii]
MDVKRVKDYTTKAVCAYGGALEYSALRRAVAKSVTVSDTALSRVVAEAQSFALVPRSGSAVPGTRIAQDTLVLAVTAVRLCKEYVRRGCAGPCGQLHLCRYFVYGNCKFSKGRKICNFSHNITSNHNATIIQNNCLSSLDPKELCQLLLQNDLSLLPEVCLFYNKGPGLNGACNFKESCTKLHICQHFIQGTCKFGSKCKRSHSFESNGSNALEHLSMEFNQALPKIYSNIYNIKNCRSCDSKEKTSTAPFSDSPISPSTDVENEEICLYYVRKNCGFKDKCRLVHYSLPYRWQVYEGAWKDLPNMEEIEKAYCDPKNTSLRSPSVDFKTMRSITKQVRRLSTASSVTKPPHYILTTEWLWYWKDEYGNWIEYGKQEGKHNASITSIELEKAYLANPNGQVEFSAGKYQYFLNFKDMFQKNVLLGTLRDVKRRPRFLSEKAVESQIRSSGKSGQELSGVAQSKSIPAHWDMSAQSDVGYKVIQLQESSEEYNQVQTLFMRTMSSSTIRKIERIQNLPLWEVFQWQKEQMKKSNSGKDVNEKSLFHGTNSSIVDAICQQNFDWRICGAHGTLYGKGSYFARDASYSHNFCKSTQSTRIMFVARVLVGQFTKGSSSFLRPPCKDGTTTSFYDSCVDDNSNPSIFVVFEKHQIYPEYIIEYREK